VRGWTGFPTSFRNIFGWSLSTPLPDSGPPIWAIQSDAAIYLIALDVQTSGYYGLLDFPLRGEQWRMASKYPAY
jgi:hypothetical protein